MDNLSGQLSNLKKSRFIRDVSIVAGGTAAAQAITVAFSPIITRLYGPEAFGILGVFIAIVGMITPAASLAYTHAIVLPASDSDAKAIVRLSILIASCFNTLLTVVIVFYHEQVAIFFGFGVSAYYLLFIPVVIFFVIVEKTLNNWLIRKKQFSSMSGVAVVQAAAVNSTKAGFGLILATAPVLIVFNVIGHIFHAFLLWLKARATYTNQNNQEVPVVFEKKVSIKTVAHTYRDFPLYRSPQLILSAISHSIPTLMLAAYFGPVPAGFYALSRRVLVMPKFIISNSIGKAFMPRLAEAAQKGVSLRPYLIKATTGLAFIGLLPFASVFVFGPWLFGFVFGTDWISAGEYARWLAIWLYFGFILVPCEKAIPFLGLQGYYLIYEILMFIAQFGTLIYGAIVLKNDTTAVALFSIAGAALFICLIFFVLLNSNKRLRKDYVFSNTIDNFID